MRLRGFGKTSDYMHDQCERAGSDDGIEYRLCQVLGKMASNVVFARFWV